VSFIRHKKIYRHDVQGEGEHKSNFPSDHRCDESSAGYSSVGCSPAAPTSASPAVNSFSLYSAAVQFSAANRNCPSIALSQPRGPLQVSSSLIFPYLPSQWETCTPRAVPSRDAGVLYATSAVRLSWAVRIGAAGTTTSTSPVATS
jgi:hypothetical protein